MVGIAVDQSALFLLHKYDTFPLCQKCNRCNLLTHGIIGVSTEKRAANLGD